MDLQNQFETHRPLVHDIAKSLIIFSVLFGVAFGSYLMLSLLFFSFKTFLVLFSLAVAWGAWFNYNDRRVQDGLDGPYQAG